MSEPTITAAIKTLIESIQTINKVYDFEQWTKNVQTKFKDNDKILGFEITIPRMEYERVNVMGNKYYIHYNYIVFGYLSLSNRFESTKTLKALAQLVMLNLLKGQVDSNNKIVSTQQGSLTNIRIDYDFINLMGEVLCNRASIYFTLTEMVDADNILEYGDLETIACLYNFPEYDDKEYDSRLDMTGYTYPGDKADDIIILQEP